MEITYAVLIALNILALVAIATLSESIKTIAVFKKSKEQK
ncbi:MAG: hypothetical protein RLZZ414_57 [Bacteroidota bacterium]|jgi:hypothetical protein